MAKRLTDTDKWKKPFIKSLPVEYKIFWIYLLDDCDMAGIWHVDFEVAELRLGLKLSQQKAQGLFNEKVVVFDNGSKWFLPDFIPFQYGELTEKNKMYKSVTTVLKKYHLMGHLSPIDGGKDKDKVKDKVKDIKGVIGGFENLADEYWKQTMVVEQVCMKYHIKPEILTIWLYKFVQHCKITNDTDKTLQDFTRHFANWLQKQKDIPNPPETTNERLKRLIKKQNGNAA